MENNSLIKQNQATRLAKKFVRVFRKHHTGKKKKNWPNQYVNIRVLVLFKKEPTTVTNSCHFLVLSAKMSILDVTLIHGFLLLLIKVKLSKDKYCVISLIYGAKKMHKHSKMKTDSFCCHYHLW